jgi:hypothetical protein
MKDDVRCTPSYNLGKMIGVADVAPRVLNEQLGDVRSLEVVGVTGWFKRVTSDMGAELVEPQGQPGAFEPSVPCHEDGFLSKAGQVADHGLSRFHVY